MPHSTPKQKAALYLDKKKFQYYRENTTSVLTFTFQSSLVMDMDVLNRDELVAQIKLFINENKITPANLIIILSDAICFEKLIPITQSHPQDKEIQEFLNNIPFENISSKVIKLEKNVRVIAINKDLSETVKEAFELAGFIVSAIVPISLPSINADPKMTLETGLGQLILKKFDLVKKETFIEYSPLRIVPQQANVNHPIKKKSSRLPLLVGVFIILIGVLVALLLLGNRPISKKPEVTSTIPLITKTIPSLSPTQIQVSSSSAFLIKGDINIQVLNGSGITGQAEMIKNRLANLGFTSIEIGNKTTIKSARTLIIFAQKVPLKTREEIVNEIKKDISDISIQESNELKFDVVITISKPIPAKPLTNTP